MVARIQFKHIEEPREIFLGFDVPAASMSEAYENLESIEISSNALSTYVPNELGNGK